MKKVLLTENEYRKVCEILNEFTIETLNEFTIDKTVKIGDQVWMAENLAIDDGGEGISYNEKNGEYCYTWDAAMRVAKSIPGWHLPSAKEWNKAALACGATEVPYEDGDPNLNDYEDAKVFNDKLGAKFAGYYNSSFYMVGETSCFWTSTIESTVEAYYKIISDDTSVYSSTNYKDNGYSVRLVKD